VFVVAVLLLLLHLGVALTGHLWAPYTANAMLVGAPYSPPSPQHWLGTDNFGRDVFSRVVLGERIVLSSALLAAALAVAGGASLGITLAYRRGWPDAIAMRIIEILISIPPFILALLVLGALGSNFVLIVLLVAFFYLPRVAMVVRAATLDIVTEDFVTLARLRGESTLSIALRELLPNVMSTVFVEFSLRTGYAVLFIGGLSFLGFGAPPPSPEWGLMINEGRSYLTTAPWSVLGPSLSLASLVIALSLFTEGLSDLLGLSVRRERVG
jgi:peptide/nickel transport system permease protein